MKLLSFFFALLLLSCSPNENAGKGGAKEKQTVHNAPADYSAVAGTYHVYQSSAMGYSFQHKFELKPDGKYVIYDKEAAFSFEPETRTVRFSGGSLNGYVGVLTRTDYLNEERKPMIVLDFHENASVPDTLSLDKKPVGYFQYAYLQQDAESN